MDRRSIGVSTIVGNILNVYLEKLTLTRASVDRGNTGILTIIGNSECKS